MGMSVDTRGLLRCQCCPILGLIIGIYFLARFNWQAAVPQLCRSTRVSGGSFSSQIFLTVRGELEKRPTQLACDTTTVETVEKLRPRLFIQSLVVQTRRLGFKSAQHWRNMFY